MTEIADLRASLDRVQHRLSYLGRLETAHGPSAPRQVLRAVLEAECEDLQGRLSRTERRAVPLCSDESFRDYDWRSVDGTEAVFVIALLDAEGLIEQAEALICGEGVRASDLGLAVYRFSVRMHWPELDEEVF